MKQTLRTNFTERKGKLADLDRSFDLKFWQAQSAEARFAATWEMVVHSMKVQGRNVRQLRLQRNIQKFEKQKRS